MTKERAIAIFKAWIQKDKELQEKGLMDRTENIELYNMAIEALKQKSNDDWIPIETSTEEDEDGKKYEIVIGTLPEEGQEVIITTEGGFVETDVFNYDYDEDGRMGCFFDGHDIDEVRAWMPFPEPYQHKQSAEADIRDTAQILRSVGRYIQTQAEQNGLKALGVNGIVYNVEDVLQELDALIRNEEGAT